MAQKHTDNKPIKTLVKRDGTLVKFDGEKIKIALRKANYNLSEIDKITSIQIQEICDKALFELGLSLRSVEDIQDFILTKIKQLGLEKLYQNYSQYRQQRELLRNSTNTTDDSIIALTKLVNDELNTENSNKDSVLNSTQRDLIAGEVSKDITRRYLLPKHILKAHDDGILHFHDMDYFLQHMHNCTLVNLDDMLNNGTIINGNLIEKPKSFRTACTVATQIIAQVASAQYGGQTISLAHLSPFVEISRQKIKQQMINEFDGINIPLHKFQHILQQRVEQEVKDGIQTIQYQVETIMSTNGQAPFLSIFMHINEAEPSLRDDLVLIIKVMLEQRILGVKNSNGIYVAPAFPKLLYVLDENNTYPNSQYYYLTELAAKCSAKRLVPDYISAKKMAEYKNGEVFACMGCRSFLSTYYTNNGDFKSYGRFNQGVVTLNLPDVALSAATDLNRFWEIFSERLKLVKEALLIRHKRLLGTVSDVAPILWQNGAIARLKSGETIDKLLFDGYSTISVGYAGLYECVKYMTKQSHTSAKGNEFALQILHFLNDHAEKWRNETNIGFSVYGSPIESTTYRFATCLQRRFGIVKGITDKKYITNSYHVHVQEPIDAFTKLSLEGEFQKYSQGGCISYVEVPNMQKNIAAMLAIMQFIYENTMYAEINTKADYCMQCGFDGEILIDNQLNWYCPQCHNMDQNKMQVTRRTCGYIGSHYWNKGRTEEISQRVLHIGQD